MKTRRRPVTDVAAITMTLQVKLNNQKKNERHRKILTYRRGFCVKLKRTKPQLRNFRRIIGSFYGKLTSSCDQLDNLYQIQHRLSAKLTTLFALCNYKRDSGNVYLALLAMLARLTRYRFCHRPFESMSWNSWSIFPVATKCEFKNVVRLTTPLLQSDDGQWCSVPTASPRYRDLRG